jgi:predicted nuclease with TOPRIM domain
MNFTNTKQGSLFKSLILGAALAFTLTACSDGKKETSGKEPLKDSPETIVEKANILDEMQHLQNKVGETQQRVDDITRKRDSLLAEEQKQLEELSQ